MCVYLCMSRRLLKLEASVASEAVVTHGCTGHGYWETNSGLLQKQSANFPV